jgi:hypothetical protein
MPHTPVSPQGLPDNLFLTAELVIYRKTVEQW